MLQDGIYTIVYPKFNTHRTLKIETPTCGKFARKSIVSYLSGPDNENNYTGFGFVNLQTGVVSFWSRFRAYESPEKLQRMQAAVNRIKANPLAAGEAYALQSGRCFRCNRTLTVPASVNRGLGPECAKKWAAPCADIPPTPENGTAPALARPTPRFKHAQHTQAYQFQQPSDPTVGF